MEAKAVINHELQVRNKSTTMIMSVITIMLMSMSITGCTNQAAAKINFLYKDTSPRSGVIAKIGNEEITEEKLIGEDKTDFFELKKREYDLKIDRLTKLMVDTLIGSEAKKANLPLEEFINKKIINKELTISEKEYQKFIEEKHIPETQINPQIKEKIIAFLQATKRQEAITAHLAKLTKSNPVEVYFKKPKMDIQIDIGDSPLYGKKTAKVSVIVFSDFQCPFCSRGAESVQKLRKKYGNKISIAFKHFPLPMHPQAKTASEASMCVHEQNADKFWKYHDLLFKNQTKIDQESLTQYAKEIGVNVEKFSDCLNSKKFADYIQKDINAGEKIGIRSTPTFLVNGNLISGAVPIETFSEIIDDEL